MVISWRLKCDQPFSKKKPEGISQPLRTLITCIWESTLQVVWISRHWLTICFSYKRCPSRTTPKQFDLVHRKALRTRSGKFIPEQELHWQLNEYWCLRSRWRSLRSHCPTCKQILMLMREDACCFHSCFTLSQWSLSCFDIYVYAN